MSSNPDRDRLELLRPEEAYYNDKINVLRIYFSRATADHAKWAVSRIQKDLYLGRNTVLSAANAEGTSVDMQMSNIRYQDIIEALDSIFGAKNITRTPDYIVTPFSKTTYITHINLDGVAPV
ncbi:MAG: hypothetical protein LRZ85_05010 [Alphaproteobacteria bacterium]|nr:hypothetical protein [Alphaproteobacteria bacterium]MCD8520343.1 hypothetical protein [Alphaproteobacteria bacterium]MCD8571717.1 hypothetical protein [Alphaproteobacteria bacterium]